MTSVDDLPVPGWYADPRGENSLRWWNGRAWTEQTAVAPGGGAFAPPVVPSATAAQDTPPAVAAVASPPRVAFVATAGRPAVVVAGRSRPLSGWWARAAAFIVDYLITIAFLLPFIVAAILVVAGIDFSVVRIVNGQLKGLTTADEVSIGIAVLILLAGNLLVSFTYQPLTMARKGEQNGRTWGMQVVGIRVVRQNGAAMSYGPALVRQFLVMGLLYAVISGIGNAFTVIGGTVAIALAYLWPLWDKQNRALQDFICSTHVVRD
ncbi:MAG: RDD family protein [Actinomycetes bacterium]